ncbi:MAG: pantothenate kinase [Methanosarcinales archaeon]|jgi:pantoate kinase|nr:pantothenate kinase [Methanosarcinales archaeon]
MSEFETCAAFSPGHITGFFQIRDHSDPHIKGSIGAGLVLNQGICSEVTPYRGKGENAVYLNGVKQNSAESANAVLTVISELSKSAEQKYNSPFYFEIKENISLPIGSGFGLSAAGALSAAFAAGSALHLGLSDNTLIEIAHYAEIINGSGLGDVAGIAAGGLAVREIPGGSLHGKYYSVPLPKTDRRKKIYCLVLGELSTKAVITNADCAGKINKAGAEAFKNFLKKPDLDSFMTESLSFTKSAGLLSSEAEAVIDSIDKADGTAAQAMIGNTVFAVPSGREGADKYIFDLMRRFGDVYECEIEANGPRVCSPPF